MINACPTCKTALCDAEVEHTPTEQVLYDIVFPLVNPKGNQDNNTSHFSLFTSHLKEGEAFLTISTVRPEVIFADAAVAVHPKDKRYKHLVGGKVTIPLTDKQIPIIADECVDMKFGTGVLQITPAYSHNDYDIAIKHGLEIPRDPLPTREETVARLKVANLIVKEKKHTSNLTTCYRCHKAVEPTLSKQWFIRMTELAKPAIEAVISGELKIVPKAMEKIYLHWLRNIKDWCISRQLTSGHKIPIEGVEDVLDTWYSSGLWPLATLGWAGDDLTDFNYFYPNQVMIMGYEILFFWAIRMVFFGQELTGKLPFENLVFHGIVRDSQGRKMSKSLGNGIDPLEVIGEYGADALRFSLISGTKIQRDQRYDINKATLARNFINKIWNATRLITSGNETNSPLSQGESPEGGRGVVHARSFSLADKWILTKLNTVIKSTTKKYEKYDFGTACTELQNFFWSDFCDWYLEASKLSRNQFVLETVLTTFLKLINPIMPFVTEEIFCNVLKKGESLLHEPFPTENKTHNFPKERKAFEETTQLITWLRSTGGDANVIKSLLKGDLPKDEVDKLIAKKTQAQIEHLKKEIERGERMLGNPGFVAKAKKALVKEERDKLATNKKMLQKLEV